MFRGIETGWDVFKASFKVFGKYPIMLIPIFIVWLIYAPTVIYFKRLFNWEKYSLTEIFLIVFLIILGFAILLTVSCSVLLELIQQIETRKKISLLNAWGETVTKNLIKIIPLAITWAIIWFILTVIDVMIDAITKGRHKKGKERMTPRNVAKTLGGYDRISLWTLSIDILQKGIRMMVFLIIPAFAWENLGFSRSIKKGFAVFKSHLEEFATGFSLTYLAATIIFLPPGLLLYITGKLDIALPDWVWFLTIIYIAFGWSYSLYLEQMFVADLYLWHLKWEEKYEKSRLTGKDIPSGLWAVQKPSILDDVPDLFKKS